MLLELVSNPATKNTKAWAAICSMVSPFPPEIQQQIHEVIPTYVLALPQLHRFADYAVEELGDIRVKDTHRKAELGQRAEVGHLKDAPTDTSVAVPEDPTPHLAELRLRFPQAAALGSKGAASNHVGGVAGHQIMELQNSALISR